MLEQIYGFVEKWRLSQTNEIEWFFFQMLRYQNWVIGWAFHRKIKTLGMEKQAFEYRDKSIFI